MNSQKNHKNKYKSNSLKAFTLAEALLTLGVIGIVASMTLPTLIQSSQKKHYAAKAIKSYSVISQATIMMMAENEGNLVGYFADTDDMIAKYKTKLRLVKECPAGDDGCWPSGTTVLHSDNYVNNNPNYYSSNFATAVGVNGITYAFRLNSSNCDHSSVQRNGENLQCGYITFNANGEQPPNKYGMDTFNVSITKYGAEPRGASGHCDGGSNPLSHSDYCNSLGGQDEWNGASCLAKIIGDGNRITY